MGNPRIIAIRFRGRREAAVRWTRISAVLGAILLAAWAQAAGGPGGDRFTDDVNGYSLRVPAGWSREPTIKRPLAAFLGPVQEGIQTNLLVYPELSEHRTLAQVVKDATERDAKDPSITPRRKAKATLGGKPAVLLDSVVRLKGKAPAFTRRIVAVYNGRSYTITFTVAPGALKRDARLFEMAAASFRFAH